MQTSRVAERWERIMHSIQQIMQDLESKEQDEISNDIAISKLFNRFEDMGLADTGDPTDGLFVTFHHPDGGNRRLTISTAAYLYDEPDPETEFDEDDTDTQDIE